MEVPDRTALAGERARRPPRPVYRKVGADRVGRSTSDKYEGYVNNQKTAKPCTLDSSALSFVAPDFEVSRKLAAFLKTLVSQDADNVFSLGKPDEPGFSGVHLHRIFTTAGRQTTTEVTDVTRRRSPSTFEVPPDFTRKALGTR